METICRICLVASENLQNLRDTQSSSNSKLDLYAMFVECTAVKLKPEENSKICIDCRSTLIIAYEFIQMAQESTKFLRKIRIKKEKSHINVLLSSELIINDCSDDKFKIKEENDGKGEKISIQEFPQIQTNQNKVKSGNNTLRKNRASLNKYTKEKISNSKALLHCRFCLRHYSKLNDKLDCQKQDIINNMGVECNFCGKKFPNLNAIKAHLAIHNYSKFTCKICSLTFETGNKLKYHIGYKHGDINRKYPCQVCGKEYTRRALKIHVEEVHYSEKKFFCNVCNRGFSSRDKIRRHLDVHFFVGVNCDICNKLLKTRASLKIHMKTIHGPNYNKRIFNCKFCQRTFKTEAAVRQHKVIHTVRKIPCQICGVVLQTKNSYKYHIKTHNLKRPIFQCSYCTKSFMSEKNLMYHIRLHSGELFACDICGKTYTKQAQMTLHKQVSHEGKRFPCHYCDAVFARPNGVKRHIKDNCKKIHFEITI